MINFLIRSGPLLSHAQLSIILLIQVIHSSLYYTDVRSPTIDVVTPGEDSISLEWSPPSEGDPLSYTVTWTPSGGTSSTVLPPAAHNYTIRGLDSNTAYSGTVEVYALTNNATVRWKNYTLPQGELVSQSSLLRRKHCIHLYACKNSVSFTITTAHHYASTGV